MVTSQDAIGKKHEAAMARLDRWTDLMLRAHATRRVKRVPDFVSDEMGLAWVRTLEDDEIAAIAKHGDRSGMTRSELKGFLNAAIVMESNDQAGATCYIVMEVAFTANAGDTSKATRNARFLTRCTGIPAHPAVAGLRKDDDVVEIFESGAVHWHQLDDEDFEIH